MILGDVLTALRNSAFLADFSSFIEGYFYQVTAFHHSTYGLSAISRYYVSNCSESFNLTLCKAKSSQFDCITSHSKGGIQKNAKHKNKQRTS